MSEGRTATTLAGPARCAYCGHRCHGRTCRYCKDLERAERALWREAEAMATMRDELRAAVKRP